MLKMYIQYGCGLTAPKEWLNFDASPTLRIQKTWIIGSLLKKNLNTVFPENVRYGDIVKGLPVSDDSCDGVYCSHVLEHLALNDFRTALKHTYSILKSNGIFRCVVPDLEFSAREYVKSLDIKNNNASLHFMDTTLLGVAKRPKGARELLSSLFGNSHHLWMWDKYSLSEELLKAGFADVRTCKFNDSEDEMFGLVESEGRFQNAVSLECKK